MRFVALEGSSVASARSNILSCAFGAESMLDWVYVGSTGNCGSGGAEKGLRKCRHGVVNEQETENIDGISSSNIKEDVKLLGT